MRVINKAKAPGRVSRAKLDALVAHMSSRHEVSFDDLRKVPVLAGLTDGQIHQAAIDGGLEVGA